jgi:hypothetical protein
MLLSSMNDLDKESSITNLQDKRSEPKSGRRLDMEVGQKLGRSRRERRRRSQKSILVIGSSPENKNLRSTSQVSTRLHLQPPVMPTNTIIMPTRKKMPEVPSRASPKNSQECMTIVEKAQEVASREMGLLEILAAIKISIPQVATLPNQGHTVLRRSKKHQTNMESGSPSRNTKLPVNRSPKLRKSRRELFMRLELSSNLSTHKRGLIFCKNSML